MRFSLVFYLFLLLSLPFSIGCGGTSGINLPVGGELSTSRNEEPTVATLDGIVFLGLPVAGASVEARDSAGSSLGTAVTDDGGYFHLDGLDNSMVLTLVATLPESEFELLTLVNPNDGADFPVIGIPSTVVTRYLKDHPGETWTTAEDWFSRLAGASTAQNWGSFLDESEEMAFSHLGFFVYAARQGGIEAAVSSLLTQQPPTQLKDEETSDPLFDLEYDDFNANFEGLDFAYLNVASAVQGRERSSFSFASAGRSILTFVGEGVAGNLLNNGSQTLWTWITLGLGLNSGPDLSDVQAQLDGLSVQLSDLSRRIDTIALETAVADLNSKAITPLLVLNRQLSSLTTSFPVTDEPAFPRFDTVSLASRADQPLNWLGTIQNYMLGTSGQSNLIAQKLQLTMEGLGVDQQSHFMNMPLRSNAILGEVLRTYNLYEGYQVQACNLGAELAHLSTGEDLVSNTNLAAGSISEAAASLKLQRSQLPRPLPTDEVLADLENGLMWHLSVGPRKGSLGEARQYAKNFRLDGEGITYEDWRLPNLNELRSLRVRGRYANSGATNWSQTVNGLRKLGFGGLDSLAPDGGVWSGETESLPRKGTLHDPNPAPLVVWKGYRLNQDDSGVVRSVGRDEVLPVLVVRSIGANLHPPHFRENRALVVDPTAFSALEAPSLGSPVAVRSLEVTQGTVRGAVTYAVNVGGGFHAGRGGERQRFDLTPLRTDINVPIGRSTPYLAFKSASPDRLKVLNLPGREGEILLRSEDGAPAELRGQILGYGQGGIFPHLVEGLLSDIPAKPRQLIRIGILPRNQVHAPNGYYRYFAYGSYSDGTLDDLTGRVEWSVVDAQGASVVGASFDPSDIEGTLRLEDPSGSELRIKARLSLPGEEDKVDETKAQVIQ